MPSIIDQIREQQAWEQPKKKSSAGFIAGTVAAFAAGIVLVMSWGALPSLSTKGVSAASQQAAAPAKQREISIPTGGRLGNAAESNLLRTCMPAEMGFDGGPNAPKKELYRILQISGQLSRVANIAQIKQSAVDSGGVATLWSQVADCVYRQNGWALCDPDNRALAVEAASSLSRLVDAALSAKPEPAGPNGAPRTFAQVRAELDGRRAASPQAQAQSARAVKDRVIATLTMRAQEGRFIASDFGFFAPAEVIAAVKSAKPTSDACANKT